MQSIIFARENSRSSANSYPPSRYSSARVLSTAARLGLTSPGYRAMISAVVFFESARSHGSTPGGSDVPTNLPGA